MKHIAFILLAVISALLLISCMTITNTPSPIENPSVELKNPSCADIGEELKSILAPNSDEFDYYSFNDPEKQLDQMVISLFYSDMESGNEPDFSHVTDYYILTPLTTVATEFGVFKVDDEANINTVKEYLSNRAATRATIFSAYNEAEAKKAENVLINSHGLYVWYIMSDKNTQADTAILNSVK